MKETRNQRVDLLELPIFGNQKIVHDARSQNGRNLCADGEGSGQGFWGTRNVLLIWELITWVSSMQKNGQAVCTLYISGTYCILNLKCAI